MIAGLLLALVLVSPQAGTHGHDTVAVKLERNLYLGFELAELGQNRFRNLGLHNYTFFVGQRFWKPEWRRFGWRFLSMNVDLSSEHLADTASVCCIEGNREGLEGKLNIQRLYLEYYPIDLSWLVFQFSPVASTGLGYTYEYTRNTRHDAATSFKTVTWVLGAKLHFGLFRWLIVEYPVLELGVHPRREKRQIGDTYLDAPEYVTVFGWHNVGVRIRL